MHIINIDNKQYVKDFKYLCTFHIYVQLDYILYKIYSYICIDITILSIKYILSYISSKSFCLYTKNTYCANVLYTNLFLFVYIYFEQILYYYKNKNIFLSYFFVL